MARHNYAGKAIAGGALLGLTGYGDAEAARADIGEIVIERDMPG